MATVVYLHGVGGARPGWAEPLVLDCLNRGLAPRIMAINYADLLMETEPEMGDFVPPGCRGDTRNDGGAASGVCGQRDTSTAEHRQAYRARQISLTDTLTAVGELVGDSSPWTSLLPQPSQVLRLPWGNRWGLDQADRYVRDEFLREHIRDRISVALDVVVNGGDGPVVLIGHSLGALVALDVVSHPHARGARTRCAPDLLITLGAPLGHEDLTRHLVGRSMPMDDLGAWINVVHRFDPVQAGRGASAYFPEAQDIFLSGMTGISSIGDVAGNIKRAVTAHLDSTYLSSPTVQAAVAWGLDPACAGERAYL